MAYSFILKQARKRTHRSLREAAAALRIPPSTLSRYEEGAISRIPPERLLSMLRYYELDPPAMQEEYVREFARERLSLYEKSRRRIDAGFLYERFSQLDERGQQNVLRLLMHEAEISARLSCPDGSRQP